MGRFDYWDTEYDYESERCKGKYHYFAREVKAWNSEEMILDVLALKSLGNKFIDTVSEECVENYADLFDKLEYNVHYSPIDESKNEYILYTFEEFYKKVYGRWLYCYDSNKKEVEVNTIYNESDKYYFRDRNSIYGYSCNYDYGKGNTKGTIEEIYNILQPMYKNTYLTNGKLYEKGNI